MKNEKAVVENPPEYTVIVGNVGIVYFSREVEAAVAPAHESHTKAKTVFDEYVLISKQGVGRAGNEEVTLLENGEIIEQYIPKELLEDWEPEA